MLDGEVTEERVDSGETNVAGGGRITAILLEVLEEGDHFWNSDVIDIEGVDRSALMGSNKAKEQTEAVAVAAYRMGAQAAQQREVITEEVAQGARQDVGWLRLHWSPPDTVMSPAHRQAKRSLAELASSSTNGK